MESKRLLGLWDLIFYGIVLIQPIAPVGVFGLACKMSQGHAATAILFAMAAMMLTAWSYGRMAALYPTAGSAYTYATHGLNPSVGFLTGWAMFLDYLIIPIINVVYVALTLQRVVPAVPFAVWVAATIAAITIMNLRGIGFTARANEILLAVMTVVIVAFFYMAVKFLIHGPGLWSIRPFYDPSTFRVPTLATATSLAALTYIGFDGVSTLAEDVRNPRRTVPIATVLVCLITGILSVAEVYLGQRVWPDYNTFPNLETAFLDVTGRVAGPWLFHAMAGVLIVACFGSGLAGQAAAARLLFGMGRDGVLPQHIFGSIDRNVLSIGLLSAIGALVVSYERAAELLNFGAFLAFLAVNASVIRLHKRLAKTDALIAFLGFAFCAAIWISLPGPARLAGAVWLGIGVIYLLSRKRPR